MSHAITLSTNGDIIISPYPDNSLQFMQDMVGGYIEHLDITCKGFDLDMWVNEEGLLTGLPYNAFASYIVNQTWIENHVPVDEPYIVGDIVITGGTPDGDSRGLTLDELRAVADMAKSYAALYGIDITVED